MSHLKAVMPPVAATTGGDEQKEIKMQDIQLFNFNNNEVRVIEKGTEPWFAAPDVCRILEIGNPSQALSRLDNDERTLILNEGREINYVSESGLYALVLGSRKPEAKAFKRWITHEVLPAIRKHGGYLTPTKIEEVLTNPDTIIQLATNLKNEQEKRVQLEAKIEADRPKIDYIDKFVALRDDVVTVRDAAADLGVKESWLRNLLVNKKWIYKKSLGQRFSQSKNRLVDEYEWRAYADRSEYFVLRPHHTVIRHYNGQLKQTLYVNPAGLQAISALVDRVNKEQVA